MDASVAFGHSESGAMKLRSAFVFLALWAVCLVAWQSWGTSKYIEPLSLRYDDGDFLFVRNLPRGEVWAKWVQDISSEVGDCSSASVSYYQDTGVEPVRWRASPNLEDCIPEEGGVFIVTVKRTVLLDRWFPLRPSESVWSCVVGGPDCINIR